MPRPGTALFLVAGLSFAVLQSGCMQAPAPSPAAPDTRALDEKTIRDTEAAWVKAFATKEPEKAEAFYADDADSMLPDTPLMAGKAAIIAGMKPELGDPNFSLVFAPTKVEIAKSGDIAYSKGTFKYTTTDPKTKRRVGQVGNYVEVYKKQADGTWKVQEDIATEETPLKPLKPGE
jgi:ketosteroid isomerase-like protein